MRYISNGIYTQAHAYIYRTFVCMHVYVFIFKVDRYKIHSFILHSTFRYTDTKYGA